MKLCVDEDKLSLLHITYRSVPNNFNSLYHYIISLNQTFFIIALSDTWLNKNSEELYKLNIYNNSIIRSREKSRGCGARLFIKDEINLKIGYQRSTPRPTSW